MEEFAVDKGGEEIDEQTSELMAALKEETDCLRVVCHWHETQRVGYWSKRSSVGYREFGFVRRHGYVVDHVTQRVEGGSRVAYFEAVPEGDR